MARLAGFEPTTPWFVAKYSIQLSYSREASQYSRASRPPMSSNGSLDGGGLLVADQRTRFVARAAGGLG